MGVSGLSWSFQLINSLGAVKSEVNRFKSENGRNGITRAFVAWFTVWAFGKILDNKRVRVWRCFSYWRRTRKVKGFHFQDSLQITHPRSFFRRFPPISALIQFTPLVQSPPWKKLNKSRKNLEEIRDFLEKNLFTEFFWKFILFALTKPFTWNLYNPHNNPNVIDPNFTRRLIGTRKHKENVTKTLICHLARSL